MTNERIDLLQALGQVQNHPFFAHVDIMTITGCGMTDDQVRAHIELNISYIGSRNFREAQEAKRARRSRKAA